jgi:hypothetical protein
MENCEKKLIQNLQFHNFNLFKSSFKLLKLQIRLGFRVIGFNLFKSSFKLFKLQIRLGFWILGFRGFTTYLKFIRPIFVDKNEFVQIFKL